MVTRPLGNLHDRLNGYYGPQAHVLVHQGTNDIVKRPESVILPPAHPLKPGRKPAGQLDPGACHPAKRRLFLYHEGRCRLQADNLPISPACCD